MSSGVSRVKLRVTIRVPFGLNLVEFPVALSSGNDIKRASFRSHTHLFEHQLALSLSSVQFDTLLKISAKRCATPLCTGHKFLHRNTILRIDVGDFLSNFPCGLVSNST